MNARTRGLWWVAVVAACLVCVLVRLLFGDKMEHDGLAYHRLAVGIVEHGTFGEEGGARSWRPPLYPTFLAGIYSVFGEDPNAARAVEAVVSGIVALFVALLGRRLGLPLVGLVAVYLYAFAGAEVRHATRLYPENLASLFVVVFVWAATFPPTWWRAAGRGLLAAGLIHLQPGFVLVPLVEAAWMAWSRRRERGWVPATCLLGAFLAASTPWAVRNDAVHGRLLLVSTNGGLNLVKGYHDGADGGPTHNESPAVREISRAGPKGELARDRYFRDTALAWIREHPGTAAWLVLRRARYWYLPSYFLLPWTWYPITFGLIGPLAILGVFVAWRRRLETGVLLRTIVVLSTPSVLVVYAGSRYRMPASPLIVLFAAMPVTLLLTRLRLRFGGGGTEGPTPQEDGGGE